MARSLCEIAQAAGGQRAIWRIILYVSTSISLV
jgi:hypothetical protein